MSAHAMEPSKEVKSSTETSASFKVEGAHAEIVFDTPGSKPNVLTRRVFEQLHDHFAILKSKSEIQTLLIYSAKPGIFLAGADIEEIKSMKAKEEALNLVHTVQDLLQELADLPQKTMVAIDGACMGGGLELSLACDYRVCSESPKTKLGLPEVQLGVIPGAGGTQRLPLVVSLPDALTIITSGAPMVPRKALKIGLIDDLMPPETMLEICREKLRSGSFRSRKSKPSLMNRILSSPLGKKIVFSQAKKAILKKTKGQFPAPLKALEVIEKTYAQPIKSGLVFEAQAFADLAVTQVSKNLIGIFFASEELKKEKGVSPSELGDFKEKKLKKLAVVGAGIMGGGIAAVAARKGIWTKIKDIHNESLSTALKEAHKLFQRDLKKRKVDKAEHVRRGFRLMPGLTWSGFQHIPIVIEAVVENMDVKKTVIGEMEAVLPVEAIIASNTSSLSISEMASTAKRPERIIGMHFFNPVPMMPLVEVIRGEQTSPQTIAQTVAFGKQLGKTVIVVKDRPGFLVNRVLMPFLIECGHLKNDGYSISQIDKAATQFGMPMGPFRLLDEIGLDTAAKVANVISTAFPHMKVLPMIDEMVEKYYLGRKNGKGFYHYDKSGKATHVRSEFQSGSAVQGEAALLSIQDRLILPMVTEAVMALDEGVVQSVRDLDIGLVFGIGFPPARGGLLKWVSQIGEREILDRMSVLHNATKGRLIVPEALTNRVQNKQGFYPDSEFVDR